MYCEDARTDELGVEQGPDPEARAIGGDPADAGNGRAAEHAEADIVDHLARAQLEHADSFCSLGRGGHRFGRVWPQRDRTYVADLLAFGPQLVDDVAHELAGGAERDDHRLGVLGEAGLDPDLFGLDRRE